MLIGVISLFASCNSQPGEAKENISPAELSHTTCYSYVNKNDTVLLKTTTINSTVTGILTYNYYQKDKNKGTIQGQMKGELLLADYTFFSEGVQSVRQVAFKKNWNTFIEGYGESEEKEGKMVFKTNAKLNFSENMILNEYL